MSAALFPVVILAGGLATRLRPLTETIPKSLVGVNGKPFIFHQLTMLKARGIERVVLCIGYLGDQIIDYVGDGKTFGLDVSYSFDGERLLGTAGAIKQALNRSADLIGQHFFVLYGDSYLPCHYADVQAIYKAKKKPALMTVFHNKGQGDKSNVEFFNGDIIAYDKWQPTARMDYIDYGLGVFDANVFRDNMDHGEYDLALLYQRLLAQQQLAACVVTKQFYETGSFTGIKELEHYLLQEE